MTKDSYRLSPATRRTIASLFRRLDYPALGRIYCHQGGDAFWRARRGPCQELGTHLAEALLSRLLPGGRSLYVGAGVAELPVLVAETLELGRAVDVFSLRRGEVAVLNRACDGLPFKFHGKDASTAGGSFDHVWMVSVLNDPERFPELSALSYGRANPVTFDTKAFAKEKHAVAKLAGICLTKLTMPGLVTTSVEEIPWITAWCTKKKIRVLVGEQDYPTALVEDPVCFIQVGARKGVSRRKHGLVEDQV